MAEPGGGEYNAAVVREQIRNVPLKDIKQGGFGALKEVPGIGYVVKEVSLQGVGFAEAIFRESYAAGRLKESTFVAGIDDAREVQDQSSGERKLQYIIKKVDGPEFVPPTDPGKVADVGRELTAKMKWVADRGMVLGDLKPGNILFNGKEHIFIDFGESVRAGTPLASATFEYSSPDVVDKKQGVDSRHDVYCMASLLAEGLLGKTPNQMYFVNPDDADPRVIAAMSPEERTTRYQVVCEALKQKCGTNNRLAEVLAAGINPDRNARPDAQRFAKMMEETSSSYRAFQSVKEETFLNIDGRDYGQLQQVGAMVSDVISNDLRPKMLNQQLPPIDELRAQYFEGTNLDLIGKLAHEFADRHHGENQKRFLDQLREWYETDRPLWLFLKPGENHTMHKVTDRERQAIRFVLNLADVAERFQFMQRDVRPAMFTGYALDIMTGKEDSNSLARLNNMGDWGVVLNNLAVGFEKQQTINQQNKNSQVSPSVPQVAP